MPSPIMRHFGYENLLAEPEDVSSRCCALAKLAEKTLEDGPEKSAGLRKLLEALDCFNRAELLK